MSAPTPEEINKIMEDFRTMKPEDFPLHGKYRRASDQADSDKFWDRVFRDAGWK